MNFFSMLGADPTPGNWFEQYWYFIVIALVLVGMYVFSYIRRRKYNQQVSETLNNLKAGDKVKTYSGFYGTIISIKETTDGKVALLETGEGKYKSYSEIDLNAIYGVDSKAPVVYDKEGTVVMPEEPKAPAVVEDAAVVAESDTESETQKMLEAENKKATGKKGKK